MSTLRIGTRGSPLAHWQTDQVATALVALGESIETLPIRTTGDERTDIPLSHIGSTALFTRQLDEALLAGRIDLAVHSLKDLPSRLPDGIALAAVLPRATPWDALVGAVGATLDSLPIGATVATSSVRRRAQLLRARPDLRVVDLRGNIATRLQRLDDAPTMAATILAAAGLERLALQHRISALLPPEVMLPAPGQGAIAVTSRMADPALTDRLRAALHHEDTGRCVAAERALLRHLDGGCQVPVAAHATQTAGRMTLTARVLSLDGRVMLADADSAPVASDDQAAQLGVAIGERLRAAGADAVLDDARQGQT